MLCHSESTQWSKIAIMIIHRNYIFLLLFSLLVTLPVTGCKSTTENKNEGTTGKEAAGTKADKDDAGADKIKIFNGEGKPILKLKEKNNGYKLYAITGGDQSNQQPIAKIKFSDDGDLKVQDANGNNVYKLKMNEEDKIKIEDTEGKLLYSVKLKQEDLKVEGADGQAIYKMKKEDYGYKITDDKDQLLFKIKRANSRIVVESAEGKTTMEIKGTDNILAVSALALDKLNESQRAALMVLLNRKGDNE
jgi:hypothetical protein